MATLSMRDILIINILRPLTEFETLQRRETTGDEWKRFFPSASLSRQYVQTWSQPSFWWLHSLTTYLTKLCSNTMCNTWTNIHTGHNPALAKTPLCKCCKRFISLSHIWSKTKSVVSVVFVILWFLRASDCFIMITS